MSFRFHLGKPLISIFHDPSNPASQRALALIKAAARKPPPPIANVPAADNSNSASNVPAPSQSSNESEVDRYLREAAASPNDSTYSSLYDIEVVESDPTSDQLRTIRDTVKLGNVSRENAVQLGLKTDDLANDVLLVDWDGNRSATNLRGVQELLAEVHRERGRKSGSDSKSGGGCIIM
ncbi:unnamed protein product [Tilletia controversa]|uniref:Uncharacterized protein n=3 Tax=Tilletia TaxID=13289 RepID=A0A8X7MPK1_9BASI|nr:hypothetical protein CF336_g5418 [Tilletia laevis]KAE8202654.1 hypothetical protein CF328_g2092 [Tilletia controversa]KAE8261331.1 hypothetical protein A4X03_0g3351 [Tilletia caries]KAE8197217.1 hypothetical protein CF335_g4672 [Tilletia laevis]KAE8244909.1 hypothetical protein A4X06_0g5911 [Tilletia controversa]